MYREGRPSHLSLSADEASVGYASSIDLTQSRNHAGHRVLCRHAAVRLQPLPTSVANTPEANARDSQPRTIEEGHFQHFDESSLCPPRFLSLLLARQRCDKVRLPGFASVIGKGLLKIMGI